MVITDNSVQSINVIILELQKQIEKLEKRISELEKELKK